MSVAVQETSRLRARFFRLSLASIIAQPLLIVLIIGAILTASFVTTAASSSFAVTNAGFELTRLLRAMALIKAIAALAASAAILWRLGSPIGPAWFGAYALASCAMAAGPVLIWNMVHIGFGALLLHGGLLSALILLWRDPALAERLARLVAMRKASLKR